MNLSSSRRKLFVEVGHHIARVMWQNLGGSDPTFEVEMWDRAESVYQHGCRIMEDLGIFAFGNGVFTFKMPLDQVRDHLQRLKPETSYSFEQIIGKFLWATAGYEGSISDEKEPFNPPEHLQQAMWAFAHLGYATREPTGFQWTEKIAPIMVAEYLWTRKEDSVTTLRKNEAEQLADDIWRALPNWRRHVLARWIAGKSEMDVFIYLFRRWDGSRVRFRETTKKERISLPQGHAQATRGIAQRLMDIRAAHPF